MDRQEAGAVKAAHEALAAIPGYSGACVVLFKNGLTEAQISSTVNQDYQREAIARLHAHLNPPKLLLPGGGR